MDPRTHARRNDPRTSHAAASSINEASATSIMSRIVLDLKTNGPAHFSLIARRTGIESASVWRRVSDLLTADVIEPTGATAKGDTGRAQRVYRLKRRQEELFRE